MVPAHAHQARPDVSEPRSAASTGMAPASSRAAPTPWAHRAASRKPNEPAMPAASDDAANTTSPAAVSAPGLTRRPTSGDEQGRHRDDDGVGRQDPRDAHDAGVELPVQVGQGQHHDGGVGEGQAHRHHEERGEGGRAGSPAVVGWGAGEAGGAGTAVASRGGGSVEPPGRVGMRTSSTKGTVGPTPPPPPRFPGRGPPLGEFGAPGRRKVAQRCVAGGPGGPGRLAAWPSRCAPGPRPVGG